MALLTLIVTKKSTISLSLHNNSANLFPFRRLLAHTQLTVMVLNRSTIIIHRSIKKQSIAIALNIIRFAKFFFSPRYNDDKFEIMIGNVHQWFQIYFNLFNIT